jgi:hypothetical protein
MEHYCWSMQPYTQKFNACVIINLWHRWKEMYTAYQERLLKGNWSEFNNKIIGLQKNNDDSCGENRKIAGKLIIQQYECTRSLTHDLVARIARDTNAPSFRILLSFTRILDCIYLLFLGIYLQIQLIKKRTNLFLAAFEKGSNKYGRSEIKVAFSDG